MLDWTVVVYYHHSMGYEGFFMNERFPFLAGLLKNRFDYLKLFKILIKIDKSNFFANTICVEKTFIFILQ